MFGAHISTGVPKSSAATTEICQEDMRSTVSTWQVHCNLSVHLIFSFKQRKSDQTNMSLILVSRKSMSVNDSTPQPRVLPKYMIKKILNITYLISWKKACIFLGTNPMLAHHFILKTLHLHVISHGRFLERKY